MQKNVSSRWQLNELPFSALVLFILVWFTYGILFKAPYSGFIFNNSNARVVEIYTPQQGLTLEPDDVLVQIGPIAWTEYKSDARLEFFEGNKDGDIVDILINRDGTEMTIPWKFPGFNREEFNSRFYNIWGLAYIFWFFGAAVQLLIRPKDERWWLFITANYLTGFWLILGSLSAWHLWESSILLHAVTWLLLPVYLHLHWVFPRPLKKLPKAAWILIYFIGLAFAIAEFVQLLPRTWYALAFVLTLLGSILLEVVHFIRQADQRREVIFLAISILMAFAPSIGIGFLVLNGTTPYLAPAALFALPFMPLAYFYVIYRRQLGGLEIRVNRFITLYAFLILFGTSLLTLIVPTTNLDIEPQTWIFLVILLMMLTAFIVITGFPAFQAFVEKRFFGIKLPYQNFQETYSSRINLSTSISDLLQLLNDEVFPSLLVRQFVFTQFANGQLTTLLSKDVSQEKLPGNNDINKLSSQAGIYLSTISPPYDWVRLILPLKVGDRFIGFWLLGRRDPDDSYPQAEILILQSIANQTAIALSNILHAEQLRKMYQSDIERYEKERTHLARELHDSVLNELAALRTSLDEVSVSSKFEASYEEVTHRLREIVSELRPPMLMYGLIPAINELADNLMERHSDKIKIKVDIQTSHERLPENIEQHLFRIVQESCENAIRHAKAKNITMFGALAPKSINLTIEDDGTGFDTRLELSSLITNNHFGLAGMIERVHLIGAEINIRSSIGTGTSIHIAWAEKSDH